jgi:hypothetical protein
MYTTTQPGRATVRSLRHLDGTRHGLFSLGDETYAVLYPLLIR